MSSGAAFVRPSCHPNHQVPGIAMRILEGLSAFGTPEWPNTQGGNEFTTMARRPRIEAYGRDPAEEGGRSDSWKA